jgi:membrane associated rhomboid family serine protease
MFPLYDSTPRKRIPYVNYLLILANMAMFLVQITAPDFDGFVFEYGFIPLYFDASDPRTYFYILSSMFMHGGWFHILSNLWFLHIFGDNVEEAMGHLAYLMFYLLAGFAATMTQYYLSPVDTLPLIGASGAISGVAGAYMVYYFRSSVVSLVMLGIFVTTLRVPTWIFLGYWFVLQVFQGLGTIGSVQYQQGGVAWWAHIGGFVFGFVTALLLRPIFRRE